MAIHPLRQRSHSCYTLTRKSILLRICLPYIYFSFAQKMPGSLLNCVTYIYDRYYIRTHFYVFLFGVKKREFDLEDDLVGVHHARYLSAQSFIRLLKLV